MSATPHDGLVPVDHAALSDDELLVLHAARAYRSDGAGEALAVLPNGRRVVPRTKGPSCGGVACSHEHIDTDDCHECVNTGLAGPYPDMMADQMEALGGRPVDDHPHPAIGGFVIPCPKCQPDAYPDGFPGLRGPLGTWLIPPG
jgi:hypothetical protein